MFKNICRSSNLIRKTSTPSSPTYLQFSSVGASGCNSLGNVRSSNTLQASYILHCNNPKLYSTPHNFTHIRTMAGAVQANTPKFTNRLAKEKSPYLLQHAHNPVDWYPWCDEAIEKAREENKVIFLSIGYSTCHWCHVMERESFEDEAVAAHMNKHFVNIKVDREERPDLDKVYMQFVVLLNDGSGGWPMSVWLTPDLVPITAGTYFPPNNRYGMPSFTTVIKVVASKWASNPDKLKESGAQVVETIKRTVNLNFSELNCAIGCECVDCVDGKLQQCLQIYKQRFDQLHGGFGSHPKFPEVSRLNFLLHAYIVTKENELLKMVLETLQHIGNGGIHDHVFGGFARYSVDRVWHVPHFEKMLYDQGQLMTVYANAYKLTGDVQYLDFGDGIFRYIMKDLHHPDGGFYAGEDADSLPTADDTVKIEGAFYAWTFDEIKSAVESNAALYNSIGGIKPTVVFDIFAYHYGLNPVGNVEPSSDPHGHLLSKNILTVRGSKAETCSKFNIQQEQLLQILSITKNILHEIRDQRPRPHLDTKIICAWNGLALSGLAKLANCYSPKREEYMKAASKLVAFLRVNIYDSGRKVLFRSCYGVSVDNTELESVESERIDGFVDDYAFLIKGLLDYYKASLNTSALEWAKDLQDTQNTLFWDANKGGYFYAKESSPNLIMRLKDDYDGAEPSGNSVSARNLILLANYYDEESYKVHAKKIFEFFSDMKFFGYACPEMLSAEILLEYGLDLVAVVGPDSETTQRFVEVCRKFYIPGMIIFHVDPENPDALTYNQRVQEKFKMVNEKPTVYLCHDRVCRMPVTDPSQLENNLKERFFEKRV